MENNLLERQSRDIAIIGGSGSGKTVLAAGLYATSNGRSVEALQGERYLEELKKSLEMGDWPDPTNTEKGENLRLIIKRKKWDAEVSFKDYMGERVSGRGGLNGAKESQETSEHKFEVFCEKLGDPDGALILLNPKMYELQLTPDEKEEEREERVKQRNLMIRRVKKIIKYLSSDKKKCKYIALVTTAKDVLEQFTKEQRENYFRYHDEIKNSLQLCRKFKGVECIPVTVTGPVQGAGKSLLAPGTVNNAWEPFEWILDSLESEACHRRIFGKLKKFFIKAASLCVVGAASFGSWYYWFDRKTEREIGELVVANGMALEKAVKDGKLSDINKSCGTLEKGLKKFEGKRPFFRQNRERLVALAGDVVRRIEGGRLVWYPGEIERFEKEITEIDAEKGLSVEDYGNQLDQLRDFDKKVTAFKVTTAEFTNRVPVVLGKWQDSRARIVAALEAACCKGCQFKIRSEAVSIRESLESKDNQDKVVEIKPLLEARESIADEYAKADLGPAAKRQLAGLMQDTVTVWSNLIVRIDGHNADVLKLRFAAHETEASSKASEQVCKEWRQEFVAWCPASAEGRDLQKRLLGDFDQKREMWRKAYEMRRYEDGFRSLLSRLEKSGQNLDDGDELRAVLVECRKYEKYGKDESSLPLVDFGLRKSTWEKVMAGRTVLLDELLQSTISRIKPDGDAVPTLSEDDSKFLSAVLKDESSMAKDEYARWTNELNRKVEGIRKAWETKQNAACDKITTEIEGSRDAYGALKKFNNFYSEHSNAPKIKSVAAKVDVVAMWSFGELVKETVGYRSEAKPVFDAPAMMARAKRMNDTLSRLRELVQAAAKVKILKDFSAGKFAEGCRSVGNVDGGVARAFRHRYEISRIDVQINYTKFQSNFKCVRVDASVVSLDGQGGSLVLQNVGQCAELTRDDNGRWRTVWSGWASADGSPWLDALFSVKLTDVNTTWRAKDQSGEWRWNLAACHGDDQPYIEGECELNTGRWTGDSKPKINVRIYVKETGADFFDFVKKFDFGNIQ